MKRSREIDPLAPRPNLDFSKGVRGKHLERVREGTNLVVRGLKNVAERTVNERP